MQGAESLLADRAITQVIASKSDAQVITLSSDEIEIGVITDNLAPSLFGDQRVVVIKEIQDLDSECSDEIATYLENQDENLTLLLWHKGGVKGKALVDKIKNEQKRGLAVLFTLSIGIAGFYFLNSRPQSQMPIISDMPPIISQAEPAKLIINVAGKVANPGVYQLPSGSRVIDAIEAAGNQLKGVDISDINLARVLVDGEQILVGASKYSARKVVAKKVSPDNPLDINRVS